MYREIEGEDVILEKDPTYTLTEDGAFSTLPASLSFRRRCLCGPSPADRPVPNASSGRHRAVRELAGDGPGAGLAPVLDRPGRPDDRAAGGLEALQESRRRGVLLQLCEWREPVGSPVRRGVPGALPRAAPGVHPGRAAAACVGGVRLGHRARPAVLGRRGRGRPGARAPRRGGQEAPTKGAERHRPATRALCGEPTRRERRGGVGSIRGGREGREGRQGLVASRGESARRAAPCRRGPGGAGAPARGRDADRTVWPAASFRFAGRCFAGGRGRGRRDGRRGREELVSGLAGQGRGGKFGQRRASGNGSDASKGEREWEGGEHKSSEGAVNVPAVRA